MITGQQILERGLIRDGTDQNLKNSTFDLTIGQIIPIGKRAFLSRRNRDLPAMYFLKYREMVWILSREEFNMPANVTGIATLRTTFTKQGILALNVGIIDPLFHGPISTALINFSDRPRRIDVGDKFFRIAFFEHDDVRAYHRSEESTVRREYLRSLEETSYSDFSKSFLNIPSFDDDYYAKKFWSILYYGFTRNKLVSIPVTVVFLLTFWFLLEQGLWNFITTKWILIGEWFKSYKFW